MRRKLFDTHCDTLMPYVNNREGFNKGGFDVTYDKLCTYDNVIQTFAMFFNILDGQESLKKLASDYIDAFSHMLDTYDIRHIMSAADIEHIEKHGGRGALLSIESACVFEDDDKDLDFYADKGVKLISLTHFANTQYGCGNLMSDAPNSISDERFIKLRGDGKDTGLTERGKAIIAKMESRNITLDISHLSFMAIEQVCEIAKRPFVASHSNIYDVHNNNRNLKKEIVLHMIAQQCLMGICFFPGFICDKEVVTLDDVIKHIEYVLALGGENNLCLGSDFDGIHLKIKGLEDVSKSYNIAEYMLKHNYSETIVNKIMWDNAKNFFIKNL